MRTELHYKINTISRIRMNFLRPTKSDIRQIDALSKLCVSMDDAAKVLGISDATLQKWKERNSRIAEALKPKPRPEYTLNHPDFAPMVEEAFVCGGKRFYRFKDEFKMSTGRYKYYYAELRTVDLRMSLDKLKEYVTAFKAVLNGGKKNTINMGALWELILNLETRTKLAFEPASVKNLAAVAYFDDTEDLTTFDPEYGRQKIKLWEEHNIHDFFFKKPIGELLNLNDSSITSCLEYLPMAEEILADLNSGLQKVSEENS